MPPIKISNPENSTPFYIQKLIKKQRQYRKRRLKREQEWIGKRRPAKPQEDADAPKD